MSAPLMDIQARWTRREAAWQGSSPLPLPCHNRGLCFDPSGAKQHRQHGAVHGGTWEEGLTALPRGFGVSSYPGTQHGRKGPRLGCPVSTDLPSASAGSSGELPHQEPGKPSSAGPYLAHKSSSKGPSQGFSVAQILSLAWSRELPPGSGEATPSGGGRREQGGCKAGLLIAPAQLDGGRQGWGCAGQKQHRVCDIPGWIPVSWAVPLRHRPALLHPSEGAGGSKT